MATQLPGPWIEQGRSATSLTATTVTRRPKSVRAPDTLPGYRDNTRYVRRSPIFSSSSNPSLKTKHASLSEVIAKGNAFSTISRLTNTNTKQKKEGEMHTEYLTPGSNRGAGHGLASLTVKHPIHGHYQSGFPSYQVTDRTLRLTILLFFGYVSCPLLKAKHTSLSELAVNVNISPEMKYLPSRSTNPKKK